MSDQGGNLRPAGSDEVQENKKKCLVKSYLGFIDTNVLFKKPVSCLFAILSLLLPIYVLSQFIQFRIFEIGEAKYIAACILVLLILAFAGVFGAFIWWFRRIVRNEGPEWYINLRRFIQTAGEWLGTIVAISVFGVILVLVIFLSEEYHMIVRTLPFPIPDVNIVTAFYGLIAGFVIIIATKIFLFLLDPLIWLLKQIWNLIKRFVLFCCRCIVSFSGTIEKNTPFWIGVTWILAGAAIVTCLVMCFTFRNLPSVIALAASLGFMGYLMFKRKHYDV